MDSRDTAQFEGWAWWHFQLSVLGRKGMWVWTMACWEPSSLPSLVEVGWGTSSQEQAVALAEGDLDMRGDRDNVGNEGNFPRERGKRRKRSLSAQIIIKPGVVIYGRQAGSSGLHLPSRLHPWCPQRPAGGGGGEASGRRPAPKLCFVSWGQSPSVCRALMSAIWGDLTEQ